LNLKHNNVSVTVQLNA